MGNYLGLLLLLFLFLLLLHPQFILLLKRSRKGERVLQVLQKSLKNFVINRQVSLPIRFSREKKTRPTPSLSILLLAYPPKKHHITSPLPSTPISFLCSLSLHMSTIIERSHLMQRFDVEATFDCVTPRKQSPASVRKTKGKGITHSLRKSPHSFHHGTRTPKMSFADCMQSHHS